LLVAFFRFPDLAADLPAFDLRRADVLREVIWFETWVEPKRIEAGTVRFKSALIGVSQIAPIRDK